MEWVETTAKSVDEAKDLALDKLGVDESEAQFEVLEEPTKGLFGRTRGEARVRARVEPKSPRAKDDRRDKRGRKRGRGGSGSGGGNGGNGGKNTRSNAPEKKSDESAAPSNEGKERSKNQGRSRSKSDSSSGRGGQRRPNGPKPERQQKEESSMEDVRDCVETFLEGLTTAFDIDTSVRIDTDDDEIRAEIEGKHGLLLGPKARTLDAIQELTRVTAQRTAPSSIRIKVDVGGYREARRNALASFAAKAAEKATAEGVEVSLDAMSSADRKVVHDALTGHETVTTRSAGTDPRRFVVVVPNEPAVDDAGGDDEAESADD